MRVLKLALVSGDEIHACVCSVCACVCSVCACVCVVCVRDSYGPISTETSCQAYVVQDVLLLNFCRNVRNFPHDD